MLDLLVGAQQRHPAGLGRAVELVELRVREVVEDRELRVLARRRRRDHQLAHAAHVVTRLHLFRQSQRHDVVRGDERRERDVLRRHRREERLRIEAPAVVDDAGRAEVGEREREVERVRVAHRHHQQRRVVAREAHVERRHERDQRAALVVADRALGLAGRARRVHQRPRVGRLHVRVGLGVRGSGEQRLVAGPARPRVESPRRIHPPAAIASSPRRPSTRSTSSSSTMNARASQCSAMYRISGPTRRKLIGHRDEPGLGQRDVDLHPLDAVVREQRDPIALPADRARAAHWRAGTRARSTART